MIPFWAVIDLHYFDVKQTIIPWKERQRFPRVSSKEDELVPSCFSSNNISISLARIFQKCPDIKSLWQNPRLNNNATTSAGDDADAPNTANRWKMDLRNHGSKFFNSLDDLIMVVDKPEELFKMLHDIGLKHKSYEVKPEHIQVKKSPKVLISNLFFFPPIGHCRWSQSHHGIRFTRQMDGQSTEIFRTINKYNRGTNQSSIDWWREMTARLLFLLSKSKILLIVPSAC